MLVNRVQLFVVDNHNLQSFQNTAQLDMFLVQKQCLSSKIWERELPASQETPDQQCSFCRDYLLPSSWGTLSPLWAPGLLSPLLFDPIPYFANYYYFIILHKKFF